MKVTINHDYFIKGFKSIPTSNYPAVSGTLMNGRDRVAFFEDDGRGGAMRIFYDNKGAEKELEFFVKDNVVFENDYFEGEPEASFIDYLIDQLLNEKQLKRWCKTKLVVKLKSKPGEYIRFNKIGNNVVAKYKDKVLADLNKRFGDDLEEVINLRYI